MAAFSSLPGQRVYCALFIKCGAIHAAAGLAPVLGNRVRSMDRNRLFWASRRGMLELDLVLLPFLENVYETLEEADRQRYVKLLEEQDQDLFAWFLRREDPADPELLRIVQIIRDNTGLQE